MYLPEPLQTGLQQQPLTWGVTGVAGFIGSNLLEALLGLNQHVVGLDNFSTGHRFNLDQVRARVTPGQWAGFRLIEGDIRDLQACRQVCDQADYVLHQAALGSVPRSIHDPILAHENNLSGFLNMLVAARDARVKNFVYATSSAVYGDHLALPKQEGVTGRPLSPYAVTKYVDELYAEVFARCYGFDSIGLRYFNVFGPRQDPDGAYAAVIPKWVSSMLAGQTVYINGNGETSRDFCYIDNVIQANLRAATCTRREGLNQVYNIAACQRTSLNQLFEMIRALLAEKSPQVAGCRPVYRDFRPGDVMHSHADISKAEQLLGYHPTHTAAAGLAETLPWYIATCSRRDGQATPDPRATRGRTNTLTTGTRLEHP